MGGELTWRAGPLAKGSNLCHGTAGQRLRVPVSVPGGRASAVWLERARAFAMHAIAQGRRRSACATAARRLSLWTGDPGLACLLWDCVRERDEFPTLHAF